MNRYIHLEEQNELRFDWKSNLLKKTIRKVYFSNLIIGNFVLGVEKILVECFSQIFYVETRNRID